MLSSMEVGRLWLRLLLLEAGEEQDFGGTGGAGSPAASVALGCCSCWYRLLPERYWKEIQSWSMI